MNARSSGTSRTALAAIAVELARQLDDRGNSATSKSMCARALQETLRDLRDGLPPEDLRDSLDALAGAADEPVGDA